jgi:uncharacterized Zn-binding protein involved in type VI secretion
MPKGLVRLGDPNVAGGVVTIAGCDPTVLVNGRPIALALGAVAPHAYHGPTATQLLPSGILVNGKPIAVWPSVDLCGDARVAGSVDVISGGA